MQGYGKCGKRSLKKYEQKIDLVGHSPVGEKFVPECCVSLTASKCFVRSQDGVIDV